MSRFARVVAAAAAVLAVAAVVGGHLLTASAVAVTAVGLVLTSSDTRRREAEQQAAFAQRLRTARREPQAVVVVRRAPAGLPARLLPVWVDVDGEARTRLPAGAEESLPVSAGDRTVVVRRPWSAGVTTTVAVPAGGSAVVEA